jgi:hypothetical protein
MSNLQWFKTVGYPFAYDSMTATPTATIKSPFVNLTPVYGTLNGINYAEFDGVTSFSGGTGVYIISNTSVIARSSSTHLPADGWTKPLCFPGVRSRSLTQIGLKFNEAPTEIPG